MSNPKQQKNLWKNIDWKDDKEKEAFFNKYFNSTKRELVTKEINKALKQHNNRLLNFIETEIREGKSKRMPNVNDVIEFINK